MKVSARNLIPGRIKAVINGLVNSEVAIEVAPGLEITSLISKRSVEALDLKPGDTVKAMIKASNVVVAMD
jgi:molybdopterin-binding protein